MFIYEYKELKIGIYLSSFISPAVLYCGLVLGDQMKRMRFYEGWEHFAH